VSVFFKLSLGLGCFFFFGFFGGGRLMVWGECVKVAWRCEVLDE
jgi:hypothetical protein